MYTIEGLTAKQVAMMKIIWAFDNHNEFEIWYSSLPYADKMTVESLLILLKHEMLEEAIDLFEPDAKEILKGFTNGNV